MQSRTVVFVGVALAVSASGCFTMNGAYHPMLHPTPKGDGNNAGAAVGMLWATNLEDGADLNMLTLPDGEGWLRMNLEGGQLELRMTPGMTFGSYRLDLLSEAQDGLGLSVAPGLGFGFWYYNDNGNNVFKLLGIAPNVTATMWLMDETVYVAPRLGFLYSKQWQDIRMGRDSNESDDSSKVLGLGVNAGYRLDADPFDLTFELSIQRAAEWDDWFDGAVYIFVPSIGAQL